MNGRMKLMAISLGAAVIAGGALLPKAASSQDQTNEEGYSGYCGGPGWMGGYGGGMMRGYRGGWMGGYGRGMGPSMMGGYGNRMGPGTFGGPGLGMISNLDLSDSQRTRINKMRDDLRREHWALMGKIQDDRVKLRDLESMSEPDPKAVGAVYADISKLRQQMIEGRFQAVNQARALLTAQQRQQVDTWRRGSWGSAGGSSGTGSGPAPAK